MSFNRDTQKIIYTIYNLPPLSATCTFHTRADHKSATAIMNQRPKSKSPHSSFSTLSPPNVKTLSFFKMVRKAAFLKPTLLFSLLFLLALFVFFSFSASRYDSDPTHFDIQAKRLNLDGGFGVKKVRVYMYDLPRKFTYGVIESYAKARNGDVLKLKYPGNQHPAEWYLFDDLTRVGSERVGSPVVRVMDPDDADLFYVPFFSSLSLVVNPIRPAGSVGPTVDYSDEVMQEKLVEWLEDQVYWKRNNGWDHVFICQDPNALYKVVDRVKNGVLLVSDFGRLGRDQASLVKDVILPYSHRINTFKGDVGVQNRKSLLFFMGNRFRKEGGKIRDILFKLLENEKDIVIKHGAQSRESRRMATQGMHTSKFCLHPAGDTPSACRLFDAIVSLCVPVIISDYIELPFEEVIDYRKIAVFVDSKSAVQPGYLLKLLRSINAKRILEYQEEMKRVKHYFEYEDPDGTVNEIWRQVSSKLPLIKQMINRDKRLVRRELTEPDCACLCSNQTGIYTTL